MSNFYLELTAKIIEKATALPENVDAVKKEIKFIAEQLRQEKDIDALIDSAFCYYIAGYYVQALYLAQQENLKKSNLIQKWLLLFLRKDFQLLEKSLDDTIVSTEYDDQYIKNQIETRGLSDIETVNRVVYFKIAESMLEILRFVKTGEEKSFIRFFKTLEVCQRLLCKTGEWATWWRLECLKMVVAEFRQNSLWTQLKSFSTDKRSTEIVEKYVIANYSTKKIIELWRTQIESLPKINDLSRCSFCVSVPTSGGKTTVAELSILRFLIDYQSQPETKCVYIAPFRKLALEIESGLTKAFSLIEPNLISTFYGGREIDIFDSREVEKARVLIVTPEKLDSMLRQYPNLLSQIKLVVADEGHMIGDHGPRGYRYRFLLERLIYKFNIRRVSTSENPRLILISGVLPNVDDFADLVSGNRANVVKVDWYPLDKPTIGSWDWTGKDLRTSDLNLVAPIPFDTKCKSPDEFEEIVAKVALSYAHTQPTMVFSASKRAIESSSLLDFLECITNNHKIFKTIPLPKNFARASKFRQYYALLEKGIAIHHASLPRDLRKEMERRIDNQQVRLLFASPTLANGVNIPFNNVLVYRLQHYYGVPIPHATFWNVVGRVGRPVRDRTTWSSLESPMVLFFLNKSPKSNDEDQKDSRLSIELTNKRAQYQVASPFLKFLEQIREKWSETSHLSISELVSNLAEKQNLKDALGEAVYGKLKKIDNISVDDFLKILDEHICALLTENEIDENNFPEWLQQSASNLVDLFVKVSEIDAQYLDDIKNAVLARFKFNAQHLSSTKRFQNYLLGLPANDCDEIKKNEDVLFEWYKDCTGIFAKDFNNGLESFINILNFVSALSICRRWQIKRRVKNDGQMSFDFKIPDKKSVAQSDLFRGWINGKELSGLEGLARGLHSKMDINDYQEGMFENNLAWGVSAIFRYLNSTAEQRGVPVTKDLDYLPAFVKYGVNSKTACQLVRFGISRVDAVKISYAYQQKLAVIEIDNEFAILEDDLSETIKSLNMFTEKELKKLKIGTKTIERVIQLQKKNNKEDINIEPEFPFFELDSFYDNN